MANQVMTTVEKKSYDDNITQIGDIHSFVAGKDLATKLMELKQQVDKNTHTSGTGSTTPTSAGIVPVYSATGFEYIDVSSFIQNPADPGKDITDGTSHYVTVAVKAGETLGSSTTWCWTKEPTPARMFTNASKSQAVSPMELHAWINAGALVKIIKTGADWFVEDVHIPVGASTASKALLADGSVKLDSSYVANDDNDIATIKTIREFRATVLQDTASNKPTIAECTTAFKTLAHFDFKKDDEFYIKSTTKDKMVLVKYRGLPASTEASPGNYWLEVLTKAV